MKVKRQKTTKKNFSIYIHSFQFRPPYQVLLDANFIHMARKTSKDLNEALPKFLGAPVRLMTSFCSYVELMKLGPEFKPSARIAKSFEKRRCPHSPPVPASECLKSIIGESNEFRYCVATQDPELRAHFRSIPGIPLLYINNSVLILEPPSQTTIDASKQMETGKLLPKPDEVTKSDHQETEVVRKKRKKKEPNPLSCKKKKKTPPAPPSKKGSSPGRPASKPESHASPADEDNINTVDSQNEHADEDRRNTSLPNSIDSREICVDDSDTHSTTKTAILTETLPAPIIKDTSSSDEEDQGGQGHGGNGRRKRKRRRTHSKKKEKTTE